MGNLDSLNNFPIPEISKGTIVPSHIYQKIQEEEERQQQLDELKKISHNIQNQLKILEKQLAFQQKESADAKQEAHNSKMIAIAAIIVTIIMAILTILL